MKNNINLPIDKRSPSYTENVSGFNKLYVKIFSGKPEPFSVFLIKMGLFEIEDPEQDKSSSIKSNPSKWDKYVQENNLNGRPRESLGRIEHFLQDSSKVNMKNNFKWEINSLIREKRKEARDRIYVLSLPNRMGGLLNKEDKDELNLLRDKMGRTI